jgi:Mrp family chromosome partitioning ATPase
MSKIFEALELAGRAREADAEPDADREANERTIDGTSRSTFADIAAPTVQRLVEPAMETPFTLHLEHTMTALYNSIQGMLPTSRGRIIEFIGPHSGTGASTLIREFAKVVAVKLKKSVLLLDADQHDPTQVRQFNLTQNEGWDAVLDRRERIDSVLHPIEGSRLTVSQLLVKESSQPLLFESSQFKGMMNRLRETFDLILVDTPPAAEYAEGLVLASKVDGVVLVLAAEETRWQVVEDVHRRLQMMGGNVLGTLLNKQKFHIPSIIYDRI